MPFAGTGCRPFANLVDAGLYALMTIPNGEPPSSVCTCPVSSTTVMSSNCISSFGISSTPNLEEQ